MASFTKEDYQRLVKHPLKTNGRLGKRELTSLVKEDTGARLTKAYDVTIHKYRNSHAKIEDSKMYIFGVYGFKILSSYTAKYAFYEVLKIWRLMISKSYGILSLSET